VAIAEFSRIIFFYSYFRLAKNTRIRSPQQSQAQERQGCEKLKSKRETIRKPVVEKFIQPILGEVFYRLTLRDDSYNENRKIQ